MSILLQNHFVPITLSVGIVKAPLLETKNSFTNWLNDVLSKYNQAVKAVDLDCTLSKAMDQLAPLAEGISTRYLFLELPGQWTAFFDNGHTGTDASGVMAVMSEKLGTTTLRLTVQPNTLRSTYSKKMEPMVQPSLRCGKKACVPRDP